MRCFIGIDLGSTTTKAVVMDEHRNVLGRGITNSRSNYDTAAAIATDPSGNAYIVGTTGASDFPVLNAIKSTLSGPANTEDGFIVKLGPGLRYRYDLDKCTGCAICYDQCPCGAITMANEPSPAAAARGESRP